MKRLHINLTVDDLDKSVAFYKALFASEPTVLKDDYAKWMLDDPKVNFAITNHEGDKGLSHLGIQVDSSEELAEVYGRLKQAQGPIFEEGETICCYAQSEKNWIADPQGVSWETFYTHGDSPVFGGDPELVAEGAALRGSVAEPAPAPTCC